MRQLAVRNGAGMPEQNIALGVDDSGPQRQFLVDCGMAPDQPADHSDVKKPPQQDDAQEHQRQHEEHAVFGPGSRFLRGGEAGLRTEQQRKQQQCLPDIRTNCHRVIHVFGKSVCDRFPRMGADAPCPCGFTAGCRLSRGLQQRKIVFSESRPGARGSYCRCLCGEAGRDPV
ncbi:hypothetical protein SDC9_98110 [bioreactor metagenome]|uniref:Uncharacterized protein n=1 Tax=bioreactor metagenome TaxID=1076179 RepID=A0A645ADS3_9ZZZZ